MLSGPTGIAQMASPPLFVTLIIYLINILHLKYLTKHIKYLISVVRYNVLLKLTMIYMLFDNLIAHLLPVY